MTRRTDVRVGTGSSADRLTPEQHYPKDTIVKSRSSRTIAAVAVTAASLAGGAALAAPADAVTPAHTDSGLHGYTEVVTAPGIASTLVGAGVVPLPVKTTRYGVSGSGADAQATYRFAIRGGNPNLSVPKGDIYHRGGIDFASVSAQLAVTGFDINLKAGKIYATSVGYKHAKVALLDLDLSGAQITKHNGRTTIADVGLKLDPVAAGVLNQTFGLDLPTDGSLVFGTGTVVVY